jgi:hypothetical protein
MNRRSVAALLLLGGLLVSTAILKAEVKTEERSQLKMEGMMGRMMGMFAGKMAKEGVVSTVAVKGNRKATFNENTGEIIDLAEQKIYELDMKKKSYKITTFEEMRKRLQEAQEKAMKAAKQERGEEKKPEVQMEVDFSVKETGQKRTINGFACREVVMTITTHEKGKTLEQSGGMVMTNHIWLGPNIPATREIADFESRYAKAMEQGLGMGDSAEQMAMVMAMYPGVREMMGKMQGERVNMEGAQILTEMTMETVQSPAQASQQQRESQDGDSGSITSVRGIGGMLGRLGRKKEPEAKAEGDASKPKNRATFMTMTHELLKVETTVLDSDLSIPAGFKEKR